MRVLWDYGPLQGTNRNSGKMIHREAWYREAGEREIEDLRARLLRDPHNPDLQEALNRELHRGGRLEERFQELDQAISEDEVNVQTWGDFGPEGEDDPNWERPEDWDDTAYEEMADLMVRLQRWPEKIRWMGHFRNIYEILEERVGEGDTTSATQVMLWRTWNEADLPRYEIPRIPYEALRNTPEEFLPKVTVVQTYAEYLAERDREDPHEPFREMGFIVKGRKIPYPDRYLPSSNWPKEYQEEWSLLKLVEYLRSDPRWVYDFGHDFKWKGPTDYREAYETRILRHWASYYRFHDRILEWAGLGEARISY